MDEVQADSINQGERRKRPREREMAISSDSIPGPEGDSIVSARVKMLSVER